MVYSADFKAKVVLEILDGELTLNQIASKYEILPKNLQNWKKQFMENMSLAFDKSTIVKEYRKEIETLQKEKDLMAKKVGELTIEKDFLQGKLNGLDLSTKQDMIESKHEELSLNQQCILLGLNKSTLYYKPIPRFSKDKDLSILNAIDMIYTNNPSYGHRRIWKQLLRDGFLIGRKLVRSAMQFMGITAIYPKPKTTLSNKQHHKYPYLLKEFKNNNNQIIINEVNKVWSTDITYIKLEKGFVYLAAIIDWNTKKILSWKLSNNIDVSLTTSVLSQALSLYPQPEIVNTDQGSQYTAKEHINILIDKGISISMDGKGRAIDNICIERFWRTLKYENIYKNDYVNIKDARAGIKKFIDYYNSERLHSSIDYNTPNEVYYKMINKLNSEVVMLQKVS